MMRDHVLYGTASAGGPNNLGTVYKFDPATGVTTVLHGFGGAPSDGASPQAALIYQDGALYGTTTLSVRSAKRSDSFVSWAELGSTMKKASFSRASVEDANSEATVTIRPFGFSRGHDLANVSPPHDVENHVDPPGRGAVS